MDINGGHYIEESLILELVKQYEDVTEGEVSDLFR